MKDTTIIYITDNILDKDIFLMCQKNILESINGLPLISVSQKPIDFGHNICVGEMERNSLTINIQMLKALEIVDTEYIAIAEHDCLYTKEHFSFIPPDKTTFWYNENVWMLHSFNDLDHPEYLGMFSTFKDRKANSQLICGTDIMLKATKDKIEIMSHPAWKKRYPSGRVGEAGAMTHKCATRLTNGKSLIWAKEKLKKYVDEYIGKNWKTKIPNIDIRHKNNFTNNRRGSHRRHELPYWGKLKDIKKMYNIK